MDSPKIYYKGNVIFKRLKQERIDILEKKGYVRKEQEGIYILEENNEFKHLFNPNIPSFKKKQYFDRLDQKELFCEDCGKPNSFHIRPVLEKDGTINFKKIVCVCKECRFEFLKKKDIVVPQFRKDFSTKTLNEEIVKEIREKYGNSRFANFLVKDKQYLELAREEKRKYSLTKIPLPPLKEDYMHDKIRIDMENVITKNLGHNIDIENQEIRLEVKKYLLGEVYGSCPCCGEYMTSETITLEHIDPKSKGGKNNISNFIGLCETCNKDKDSENILEFLRRKEFKYLPTRVLKIAYEQQGKIKKELKEIHYQIEKYIEKMKKNHQ